MTLEQAFGLVLKQLRKKANLRQVELAEMAGYTRGHISRLENGHIEPSITTLYNLAEALEMTPEEFVRRVSAKRR